MTTHTPGPWEHFPPEGNYKLRSGGHIDGNGTHKVPVCEIGWQDNTATSEANAHLITASPELLKALQTAVHVMQDNNIDEAMAGEFEIFTDAIAKATGHE